MKRERLNSISLHQEMQRSYLEYAMSVIVGRALPDARDGFKPVQRRILFAMHELGLTPDRPFKKCARVVGDVLGKYHPHGDQAVYDALVRLVQDFSCRYPVLSGHGNFGSIDDDPPAAMRYTETRLAEISNDAVLKEIDSDTVEFSPNFDGSQQEPNVLPAQLPFLILNGCTGIAVGMATSIPPHNLNEVIDGLLALIKTPELDDEKLIELIPGPDFPTGGEILLSGGIRDTYLKGKGSIPMRGIAHIEDVNPGKGKHKRTGIVITELPYQVSKSGWIEKLAEQVNDGKLNGIADIRDESDRNGMRVLIEIRRDSDPEKILESLYRKTNLQCNYGAILLALVNGQPVQLTLKKLLNNFLNFREETITKRTQNSLRKIINRLETIEGLIKALKNLRLVISLIEEAKNVSEARTKLKSALNINEKQSDGVLAMPLKKLTGLEKQALHQELNELKESKEKLSLILKDRKVLLRLMSSEFKSLKKKFGSERRSKLIEGGDELLAIKNANQRPNKEFLRKQAIESLPKDGIIVIQTDDLIRIANNKVLNRLKTDEDLNLTKETTLPKLICKVGKTPKILAISRSGKVGILRWEFARQKLDSLEKYLPSGFRGEEIVDFITISDNRNKSIGLLTSDGRFKRLKIEEILDISNRATTVLKLKDQVFVKATFICEENKDIIISTNIGRILRMRINKNDFPLMGKLAQGPIILPLFPNENIIAAFCLEKETDKNILLISKKGSLLKLNSKSLRICKKGDLGDLKFKIKNFDDELIYMYSGNTKGIINTNRGKLGQISKSKIDKLDYNKKYFKQFNLDEDEEIIKITPFTKNFD